MTVTTGDDDDDDEGPRIDPKLFKAIQSAIPRIDPEIFRSALPNIDPAIFEMAIPRIDPAIFEMAIPRIDPAIFETALPRIDPRVFEMAIPRIDPAIFETAIPKIDLDLLEASIPRIDAPAPAALQQQLNVIESQLSWAEVDDIASDIEDLYDEQISAENLTSDDDEPWDSRRFAGAAAITLGAVLIVVLIASGAASPSDFSGALSFFAGLLGYEDLHNNTFHGYVLLAMFAVAYVGPRKRDE
jgi:hypothetical protein